MTPPTRKNWACRFGLHDFPDDAHARFPGDCLPCDRDCGKAVQVGYDGLEVTHNVVKIQGRVAQIVAARYGEVRVPPAERNRPRPTTDYPGVPSP